MAGERVNDPRRRRSGLFAMDDVVGDQLFIAGWTAPADKFDPITLIDRTVAPPGQDVAVVGAEVNLCGSSAGARFCSRIRFADTFVRVGGRWRVAHIQVTRLKE